MHVFVQLAVLQHQPINKFRDNWVRGLFCHFVPETRQISTKGDLNQD